MARIDLHFAGTINQLAIPQDPGHHRVDRREGLTCLNARAVDFQIPEIRADQDTYLRGDSPAGERSTRFTLWFRR
ncbi:MAG: hypothetical protein ACRCYU_19445 [Nocardioides sp.]